MQWTRPVARFRKTVVGMPNKLERIKATGPRDNKSMRATMPIKRRQSLWQRIGDRG